MVQIHLVESVHHDEAYTSLDCNRANARLNQKFSIRSISQFKIYHSAVVGLEQRSSSALRLVQTVVKVNVESFPPWVFVVERAVRVVQPRRRLRETPTTKRYSP